MHWKFLCRTVRNVLPEKSTELYSIHVLTYQCLRFLPTYLGITYNISNMTHNCS